MTMKKPYILTGEIEHGKGLGKTVGMPTANLKVAKECELPEYGVYATKILVRDMSYQAVTNIGLRPTVDDEQQVTVESYILDFEGDIYGETVVLEVHRFLRPIQKFGSLEEVQKQVEKDIEEARKCL